MLSALLTTSAVLIVAPAPPAPAPTAATESRAPADASQPAAASARDQAASPSGAFESEPPPSFDDTEVPPPFPSEPMTLSQALKTAAEGNVDLRSNAIDVEISEARVLAAIGAYDVFLTAGLTGTLQEQPQRGSQFTFARGTRSLMGFVGFRRALETGGDIELTVNIERTLTDQPTSFFDPDSPATTIANYRIAPTLTLSHPLLRGAGLKVNRTAINRVKIATSQAEAQKLVTAQNLVRDTISAYWDVLFAARDLENKHQSVELAGRQLERTRALVSAGRAAPIDTKAVEQALAARESEVLLAENTLLEASLRLRTLMGQHFADRELLGVVPTTDPTVLPTPVDVRKQIDSSLEANPQIRQLQLALAGRRVDEIEAANNRLPQLDFSGSFTPQGRSVDTLPDPSTGTPGRKGNWGEAFRNFFADDVREDGLLADWTVTGSLTLIWDIQNRGPRGNHQAALLEIRKAELALQQIRQTVASSVILAANRLRTAAKRMDVADISLDLAEENLAAQQARFDVGRSTNFDVLQRLDERDQAAAEALNAQVGYLKALVELQALNGEILPAYGFDVG